MRVAALFVVLEALGSALVAELFAAFLVKDRAAIVSI